ncbi:ADP-ribosylglycohydrolase family protein [Nakamurella leprariae]|nr:ADP-ribosylglycohydrolase family protein [Nakamurella leprariae]
MDRAVGAVLGGATGDALGVPYEYGSRPLETPARMLGGGLGNYAPGQWSDDTEMATCILRVAATGADLRTAESLDRIAELFLEWAATDPADIGIHTRDLLGEALVERARRPDEPTGALLTRLSTERHARTGRTAGNGSLMRTAPVALAHLGDPDAIDGAARADSALTHADPIAGEACVLWCMAIDHAIRAGTLDVRVGLDRVSPAWNGWLDAAERQEPAHFADHNGWVVAALQGAWSAVVRADSLPDGLQRAVAGGGDTDTVAAIAGALLGARFGGSTVPAAERRIVHGWPGYRARDLVALAALAARGGRPDPDGWPTVGAMSYSGNGGGGRPVPHPDDPGVLLAAADALHPGVADAVVSLCRLGADEVPLAGVRPEDHVEVWLVDKEDANNDLTRAVWDAAAVVRDLRTEGRTVLLHCVHAQTRTPVVAAAYGALITGTDPGEALQRVQRVLPSAAHPRPSVVAALNAAVPQSIPPRPTGAQ